MAKHTDNSNIEAKVALREYFLSKIKNPVVLECFAGENRILYHACYRDLECTSLDKKTIPGVLSIDNKKFIASRDISGYNFFDLDAYGSPYELMLNIFKKKSLRKDKFVVIITDGMARNLGYGAGSKLIQTIINNQSGVRIPNLNDYHEYIINLMLHKLSNKYNITISESKMVKEETGNRMYYYGILCEAKAL